MAPAPRGAMLTEDRRPLGPFDGPVHRSTSAVPATSDSTTARGSPCGIPGARTSFRLPVRRPTTRHPAGGATEWRGWPRRRANHPPGTDRGVERQRHERPATAQTPSELPGERPTVTVACPPGTSTTAVELDRSTPTSIALPARGFVPSKADDAVPGIGVEPVEAARRFRQPVRVTSDLVLVEEPEPGLDPLVVAVLHLAEPPGHRSRPTPRTVKLTHHQRPLVAVRPHPSPRGLPEVTGRRPTLRRSADRSRDRAHGPSALRSGASDHFCKDPLDGSARPPDLCAWNSQTSPKP